MTIKELIKELQMYDEDKEVVLTIANVYPVLHEFVDLETGLVRLSSDCQIGFEFNLLSDNRLEIEGVW
ncbi:hypothetical protein [Streptococcus suis]|uniref:Uncharacterized protein n=1 Tax=Streptococcus suis TaxID=1307 RepID=A0A0Z8R4Q8_STRSU|nr:hypothetical protein [Streptococcus suis]ANM47598.1 hypothetical protein [Streptococcus phage phiZJ20091101-4]AML47519.1 hypothetical protein APQ97_10940 [Streptococcus suis]KPA57109.1 hypothetical protein XK23_06855 [Streptococcus suis]MBL1132382.1 hypothetical protein [Streptococcus suis]MBM6437590.1 hypothetical protein [Streptococcus suis]